METQRDAGARRKGMRGGWTGIETYSKEGVN